MEPDTTASAAHALREVIVEDIRAAGPLGEAVMILKEKEGARSFPVLIGALEAQSIAIALERAAFPRPLTHDLFLMMLARLEARLVSVSVTGVALGTFFAEIEIQRGGQTGVLDARPSDAIALALRANVPIRAAEDLLMRHDTKKQPEA